MGIDCSVECSVVLVEVSMCAGLRRSIEMVLTTIDVYGEMFRCVFSYRVRSIIRGLKRLADCVMTNKHMSCCRKFFRNIRVS